jgi:uncharacterized Zn ribbon protein
MRSKKSEGMHEDLCLNCGQRFKQNEHQQFHCDSCADSLSAEDANNQLIAWAIVASSNGLSVGRGPSIGDRLPEWFPAPDDQPMR